MAGRPGRPENMRPPQTKEEAKERGRNGGIKSGEARRRKRDMRKAAEMLLSMPVSFSSVRDSMSDMGIQEEDLSNQMAVIVSMFKEAMAGNVKAAEFLRDTVGTGAEGISQKQRMRMERERLRMERERFKKQQEEAGESGDGMPTIINVRPVEYERSPGSDEA